MKTECMPTKKAKSLQAVQRKPSPLSAPVLWNEFCCFDCFEDVRLSYARARARSRIKDKRTS